MGRAVIHGRSDIINTIKIITRFTFSDDFHDFFNFQLTVPSNHLCHQYHHHCGEKWLKNGLQLLKMSSRWEIWGRARKILLINSEMLSKSQKLLKGVNNRNHCHIHDLIVITTKWWWIPSVILGHITLPQCLHTWCCAVYLEVHLTAQCNIHTICNIHTWCCISKFGGFFSDSADRSAAVGVNGALAKLGVGLRETHIPSPVVVKENMLKLHISKVSSDRSFKPFWRIFNIFKSIYFATLLLRVPPCYVLISSCGASWNKKGADWTQCLWGRW